MSMSIGLSTLSYLDIDPWLRLTRNTEWRPGPKSDQPSGPEERNSVHHRFPFRAEICPGVYEQIMFYIKTIYYNMISRSDTFLTLFEAPKSCQKVFHKETQLFGRPTGYSTVDHTN